MRWTPEHSVFVPEIDLQHQEVFALAAELRTAVTAGEVGARLDALQRRLAVVIGSHLAHEERLMRSAGYPSREWHERQHQTARAKLAALNQSVEGGDHQETFEALEALAGWLRDHTSIADRMVGAYLRNHQRATAVIR